MSLTERALAAAEAEREYQEAERARKIARRRAMAVEAILREGERLGVDIKADDVKANRPDNPHATYMYEHELTPDATLVFRWPRRSTSNIVEMSVRPADQLYWDLPPGQESQDPRRGGTYGCYRLGHGSGFGHVETLAQIGERLKRIAEAREAWRKKHGVA